MTEKNSSVSKHLVNIESAVNSIRCEHKDHLYMQSVLAKISAWIESHSGENPANEFDRLHNFCLANVTGDMGSCLVVQDSFVQLKRELQPAENK